MLTAQQAKILACPKTADDFLKEILQSIKAIAEKGGLTHKTYIAGFGDARLYSGKPNPVQQEILNKLHQLGYKAGIRCEEKQFVDVYLFISWEDV